MFDLSLEEIKAAVKDYNECSGQAIIFYNLEDGAIFCDTESSFDEYILYETQGIVMPIMAKLTTYRREHTTTVNEIMERIGRENFKDISYI